MYLLVFTTLIVSLIGLYAQISALETGRMYARQNGIGKAMLLWQTAAMSMAANIIKVNGFVPTVGGCSLGDDLPVGSPARCPKPTGTSELNGTVTTGTTINQVYSTTPPVGPLPVHLPADYNVGIYRFYSILYHSLAGPNYVVSFLPNTGTGVFLNSAVTGVTLGITTSDLFQQIRHTGADTATFGSIDISVPQLLASGSAYPLPGFMNTATYDGAVAVIGSPDGF
jgi:hypothetical protein